jgi:hypothetical protein
MRNKLINISRAAALAICALAATQTHAAALPNVSMDVPFDFVVSGKTLPAGQYVIQRANSETGIPAFVIRNTRTRTASIAVMPQRSNGMSDKAEVVFLCMESKCFMREMKVTGQASYIANVPRAVQKERTNASVPLRSGILAD